MVALFFEFDKGGVVVATMAQETEWGPLSEPIHDDIPADSPPWRDNAFLIFWDPRHELYGTLHVSTSPNAEGRRSRLSIQLGERVIEIVEPLEPGSFSSASVAFEAGAGFEVQAERVSGAVTTAPLFPLADYTGDRSPAAFNLDKDRPLMHYQRAATVSGRLTIDGRELEIEGRGFRDRTWGFRDESSSVSEYFGFMFVFPRFAVTAMRLLGGDGKDSILGFTLSEGMTPVTDVSMTRDASGLFAATTLQIAGGETLDVRATARRAGFWCPMGWERSGPTLSAYDEFCEIRTAGGQRGIGLIEQGVTKRLY
jgi:hypothetical protein